MQNQKKKKMHEKLPRCLLDFEFIESTTFFRSYQTYYKGHFFKMMIEFRVKQTTNQGIRHSMASRGDLSIQCASAFQINPSFETFSYNLLAVVNILKSSIHDRISEKGIRAIYLLHEVSSFHDTYCVCI